jgi:hypothetical protein
MADTSGQKVVESWIRENILKPKYGCEFALRKLSLSWGGQFCFDAVSDDGRVVVNITSSPGKTSKGRSASGKMHKIKSDTLYLINAVGPVTRVQVFTEKSMAEHFEKEVRNGRYPKNVELLVVSLPPEIQAEVTRVRQLAVEEVSP